MTATNTATNQSLPTLSVRKSILVNAPQETAFRVFTSGMGSWWPLATHKIGKVEAKGVVSEPHPGGRWFEQGVDGSECNWGHVLVWDAPSRTVVTWEISADWLVDESIKSEVEVRFTSEGARTRVELEHSKLDAYGDRREQMIGLFDSPGGWTGLLDAFGKSFGAE